GVVRRHRTVESTVQRTISVVVNHVTYVDSREVHAVRVLYGNRPLHLPAAIGPRIMRNRNRVVEGCVSTHLFYLRRVDALQGGPLVFAGEGSIGCLADLQIGANQGVVERYGRRAIDCSRGW